MKRTTLLTSSDEISPYSSKFCLPRNSSLGIKNLLLLECVDSFIELFCYIVSWD